MHTLLMSLRGLIAVLVALLVWYMLATGLGAQSLVGLLLPVWVGGAIGGAVCALYSSRHALMMTAIAGSMLALGFLYGRWTTGAGFGSLVAFWPLWFPPSFYAGTVLTLQVSALVRR